MVYSAPVVPANYIEYEVSGIKVFVHQYIEKNSSDINLILKNFLLFKYVEPKGIELPNL